MELLGQLSSRQLSRVADGDIAGRNNSSRTCFVRRKNPKDRAGKINSAESAAARSTPQQNGPQVNVKEKEPLASCHRGGHA